MMVMLTDGGDDVGDANAMLQCDADGDADVADGADAYANVL